MDRSRRDGKLFNIGLGCWQMTVGLTKLRKLIRRQRGCCAYCKRGVVLTRGREAHDMKPNEATLDHVKPRADGFWREGNEVVACCECNRAKGPLDGETFKLLRDKPEELRAAVRAKSIELQAKR